MKNTSSLTNVIDFGAGRGHNGVTGGKPQKGKNCYSCGARGDGTGNGMAPLLTTQDACAYLQCTPRFLQKMVRSGRLRALKPSGKFVRFRKADLDSFMDCGATMWGLTPLRSRMWRLTRWRSRPPQNANARRQPGERLTLLTDFASSLATPAPPVNLIWFSSHPTNARKLSAPQSPRLSAGDQFSPGFRPQSASKVAGSVITAGDQR